MTSPLASPKPKVYDVTTLVSERSRHPSQLRSFLPRGVGKFGAVCGGAICPPAPHRNGRLAAQGGPGARTRRAPAGCALGASADNPPTRPGARVSPTRGPWVNPTRLAGVRWEPRPGRPWTPRAPSRPAGTRGDEGRPRPWLPAPDRPRRAAAATGDPVRASRRRGSAHAHGELSSRKPARRPVTTVRPHLLTA